MSKKLAIRGHESRGNEVIEILEMLGGKNNCDCPADDLGLCYLIDDEFDICAHYFGYDDYEDGELNIFTLEEFLKKYPFKVGDKVEVCGTNKVFTIGDMIWEDELCTVHYANMEDIEYYTANELKPYKETNMEESKDCPKAPILSNRYDYAEGKCGYVIPAGYEFDCIKEGFQTEIILKPKKPKYPKTYNECRAILNYMVGCMSGYKASLFAGLQDLLICRDAYWKIAGEQMGLGKSWEPEYAALEDNTYFTIQTFNGEIDKSATSHRNAILAFPTIEIRDAFYENFKELIEQCKELL